MIAGNLLRAGAGALVTASIIVGGTGVTNATSLTGVSTTIDLATQSVGFEIQFSDHPDLLTVDSGGRPAFQFAIYVIDPSAPFQNFSYDGWAAATAQRQILQSLSTINVNPWNPSGPSLGTLSYTLNNNILDFIVPISLLNEPNGVFNYVLESFAFGSTNPIGFVGSSAGGSGFEVANVFAPVPLPTALPLFGTGLGMLGLLGWRRQRKSALEQSLRLMKR